RAVPCFEGRSKKLRIAVAIGLKPSHFEGGADPADGGPGWELLGELYPINPRHLLDELTVEAPRISCSCRSPTGGLSHLPEPGGLLDQSSWLMDAFAAMDAAAAELKKDTG